MKEITITIEFNGRKTIITNTYPEGYPVNYSGTMGDAVWSSLQMVHDTIMVILEDRVE